MTNKIHLVVGGQFGSEAKGATAGFLSTQIPGPVMGVRVGGPNAGHTIYGACPPDCDGLDHPVPGTPKDAHPWRLRQVPVLAVSRPESTLIIAQGSEIDVDVLMDEVDSLDAAGYKVSSRIVVDANATVITPEHKLLEAQSKLNDRLGSTAKGIGAARAGRIMRTASRVSDLAGMEYPPGGFLVPAGWIDDTARILRHALDASGPVDVIVEGTQGFGLGVHTEYYPFTTSGDCRGIDLLQQCGVSPWAHRNVEVHTWLVVRPNPIRVAGNSGPLLDETTWEDLSLPTEQTTVTQKTRRVGGWDPGLVDGAVRANGGASPNLHLVLTMVDHLVPGMRDKTLLRDIVGDDLQAVRVAIGNIESSLTTDTLVELIGTGPQTMMWYRGAGIESIGVGRVVLPRVDTRAIASTIESFRQTLLRSGLAKPPAPVASASELEQWWIDRAQAEVKPMVAKAEEYGGKGAAVDLIDIGTDLARLMGQDVISVEEATELGIFFYLKGKFSRWTAALLEGRRVSDDTLHDIGIYVRMAQRTRQVGGWPYGPEKEDHGG